MTEQDELPSFEIKKASRELLDFKTAHEAIIHLYVNEGRSVPQDESRARLEMFLEERRRDIDNALGNMQRERGYSTRGAPYEEDETTRETL